MEVKSINWKTVIIDVKDLLVYLNRGEILELGKICKHTREKLTHLIFNKIYIDKIVFFNTKPTGGLKYNEMIDLLKAKFTEINPYVNSLIINNSYNAPFLLPAFNYFIPLKALRLVKVSIPNKALSIIFGGIYPLKEVALIDNFILFEENSPAQKDIDLPSALSSLEILNNVGIAVSEITLKFTLRGGNLNYFHFSEGNDQLINNLGSLLMQITKLKSVKIYLDQLTVYNYKLLTGFDSLRTVSILHYLRNYSTCSGWSAPPLSQVEHLKLDKVISSGDYILDYITKPFMCITKLTIINANLWPNNTHGIVKALVWLKTLVIYSVSGSSRLNEYILNSSTLKKLKLEGFVDLDFRFSLLAKCPGVNRVCIDTTNFTPQFVQSLENKLNEYKDWTLLNFNISLNCYKCVKYD